MKKFFLGIFAAFVVPAFLAVAILLTQPQLRHAAFRFSVELPGMVTYFLVRRHVIERDYEAANRWLDRELDLVIAFAPGRNSLLPGLIQNAEFVIQRARFPEEYAALQPFLTRLVEFRPELLPAHLWLAQALAEKRPLEAMEHLEIAANLVPADERAYRIALEIGTAANLKEQVARWCRRYPSAQLGGPHPYAYNSLFGGTGLRKLALEVVDNQGTRQVIGNAGLELAGERTYDFPLMRATTAKTLRLHFGTLPGVGIRINALRLYLGGELRQTFHEEDLRLVALGGFFLAGNEDLSVAADGETLRIFPPKEGFGDIDRIAADIVFRRLSVTSSALCSD